MTDNQPLGSPPSRQGGRGSDQSPGSPPSRQGGRGSDRIQRAYDHAARFCFNFFVLFVLANLVAWALAPRLEKSTPTRPVPMPQTVGHDYTNVKPKDDDDGRPGRTPRRDWESLQWVDTRAYRNLPSGEGDATMDEFGDFAHKGYQFEPYVGFAPYPMAGQELHVDGTGEFVHRRTVPPPGATPTGHSGTPLVVYIFGGSTTFGIYVPDSQTWPTWLWDSLQSRARSLGKDGVQVVNYGRPYYYSTQEVALLARLLKCGRRPDVVVFMDGLNDCFMPFWVTEPDAPMFTQQMTEWIHKAQFGQDWLVQYHWVPIVRLAFDLHRCWYPEPAAEAPGMTTTAVSDRIVAGYRDNVRMARSLCQTYGVKPYFFWQPCPFYHYDLGLQRRTFLIPPAMWEVFNQTYARIRQEEPDTVFLGDLMQQFGTQTPALVDNFHYSPAFSRVLGQRVADVLVRGRRPGHQEP